MNAVEHEPVPTRVLNPGVYTSVIQFFLGHGSRFSLKKSRGTPPAESVLKRNSVAYIDSIKLFSSKCR